MRANGDMGQEGVTEVVRRDQIQDLEPDVLAAGGHMGVGEPEASA